MQSCQQRPVRPAGPPCSCASAHCGPLLQHAAKALAGSCWECEKACMCSRGPHRGLPCRSMFEAPLRIRDGRITNLRISLPPNFPTGRPRAGSAPLAPLSPHPSACRPFCNPLSTLRRSHSCPCMARMCASEQGWHWLTSRVPECPNEWPPLRGAGDAAAAAPLGGHGGAPVLAGARRLEPRALAPGRPGRERHLRAVWPRRPHRQRPRALARR